MKLDSYLKTSCFFYVMSLILNLKTFVLARNETFWLEIGQIFLVRFWFLQCYYTIAGKMCLKGEADKHTKITFPFPTLNQLSLSIHLSFSLSFPPPPCSISFFIFFLPILLPLSHLFSSVLSFSSRSVSPPPSFYPCLMSSSPLPPLVISVFISLFILFFFAASVLSPPICLFIYFLVNRPPLWWEILNLENPVNCQSLQINSFLLLKTQPSIKFVC